MKRNDGILLLATGLYSFLFYKQTPGINFFLFSCALIALLGIKNPSVAGKRNWQVAAAGSLLSGFCIAYYGTTLSVIANVFSLSLLSGLSIQPRESVLVSLLFSFYSYFSSPIFVLLDWNEKREQRQQSESGNKFKRVWLIVIPVLITLLFFFMYRASNALFNDLAKHIDIDFISWNWIVFTLGGFLLLYGFFYHQHIKLFSNPDEQASGNLEFSNKPTVSLFGKPLSISDEDFSGRVLFLLLNALLLTLNILDVNFLFFGAKLPDDVTYSEFVHQGTGMLITSIVAAIIIILFYFRGALNFYEKGKVIKFLAYLWIIQNAFMLYSTALRNNLYIAEYGLTYKRIGVYVYLFLTLLGLVTTFIKILKIKSNTYLFRINGWLFYGVLVWSCFPNWDVFITNYNLAYPKYSGEKYLVQLSSSNLPQLFAMQRAARRNENPAEYSSESFSFERALGDKLYQFLLHRRHMEWRSWYYNNTSVFNDLLSLNSSGKIKSIDISSMKTGVSLSLLKDFTNISELYSGSNSLSSIYALDNFKALQRLDLRDNDLVSIKGIEGLKKLEYLNIAANQIYDYSPLYNLPKLKELHISTSVTDVQLRLLHENLPGTYIIKG